MRQSVDFMGFMVFRVFLYSIRHYAGTVLNAVLNKLKEVCACSCYHYLFHTPVSLDSVGYVV